MRGRSRWGPASEKVDLEPFPNVNLTHGQLNTYITHVRLEEINRKLRTGDVFPTYRERSPSPEPIFDVFGKRLNGREDRWRAKLEEERSKLIEATIKSNPELNKDFDHQAYLDHIMARTVDNRYGSARMMTGNKPCDKVWIPAEEYPEVNFIGLLIGPRGNTLKKMEAETGAKISIRGKGSAKEGKMDAASLAAADEPLHAFVSADSVDKVEKAIAIINKIVETAASTPEEANELKRIQLRELAALNGTLREEDAIVCSNCGQPGHRRFECQERRNITNNLICRICGGAGHMASDCLHRDNPEMLELARQRSQQIDEEYTSFLNEIGEKPTAPDYNYPAQQQQQQPMPYYPPQQMPWGAQPSQMNPWAMPPPPPPPQQ